MMWPRPIFYAALVLVLPSLAQGAGEEKCKREWPTDFRMQRYCLEQQDKGVRNVYAWMRAYGAATRDGNSYKFDKDKVIAAANAKTPWGVIALKCFGEWSGDWRMINYCLEQQTKAALSMGIQME